VDPDDVRVGTARRKRYPSRKSSAVVKEASRGRRATGWSRRNEGCVESLPVEGELFHACRRPAQTASWRSASPRPFGSSVETVSTWRALHITIHVRFQDRGRRARRRPGPPPPDVARALRIPLRAEETAAVPHRPGERESEQTRLTACGVPAERASASASTVYTRMRGPHRSGQMRL